MKHIPVMSVETLASLAIRPDGRYIDGTFGRGGHTKAILQQLGAQGRLLALDCDPAAIAAGKKDPALREALTAGRLILRHGNFSAMTRFVSELDWHEKVDGILLDLGVSSPQLDDPQRGFSFRQEGPLSMLMDTSTTNINITQDAAAWVNSASEAEIIDTLRTYGDERYSRRIAKAIIAARAQQPLTTTTALADLIARAVPRRERRKHPATRSFQAIRILVNRELEHLREALQQSLDVLTVGGVLVVITFHSLEARAFKESTTIGARGQSPGCRLRRIGRGIKPSHEEIMRNPRARSAIVRVANKTLDKQ